ncbi:MAG: cysteine hydrolase [Afipia felis]|nr:cysteine hydrolase [Afipia felis]
MTHHYIYERPRLLTEQSGYDRYFDKDHTAVVCIDMHEGHLSESEDCPCPAPRGRNLVGPIDRFNASARSLGIKIVHVRSSLRKSGVDDVKGIPSAWRLGFSQYVGELKNAGEHAIEGSAWTELRTHVAPGDEIVSSKKRLSAFYPTDLDFLLKQMDIKVIVLIGIMTDCCVLSTAFDASNRNYRVITVRDLVAGTNDELESAALKIMSLNTGLVIDSTELLGAWQAESKQS